MYMGRKRWRTGSTVPKTSTMARKVEVSIEDESGVPVDARRTAVHSSLPLAHDPVGVVVETVTVEEKEIPAPEMATDLLGTFGGFAPDAFKEGAQSASHTWPLRNM